MSSGTSSVIVTGGAGFIGSHVVDRMLAGGDRVVVVDDLSSGDAERVPDGAALEVVDITDRPALDRVVDAARPRAILHLAAQSSVTVSVKDSNRDLQVNVAGTLNVLEAARRHRAPIVFTSTGGALYGDEAPIPTPEDRPPAPLAPYGASKAAGEVYIRTWSASDGIPHAICRLGNVYGPRQSPHGEAGVVAIFSHALLNGRRPTVFGDGAPTRDYVHVEDVARALEAAIGVAGTFNVATGRETSVTTILELLQEAAGTDVEPVPAPLREGELMRSCMDPARAARELGWRAEIELSDGLAATFQSFARTAVS